LPQEVNGSVNCLTVYDGHLVAGGHFSEAGSISANRIAAWDGNLWTALGNGLTGGAYPYVNRVLAKDSTLYVVGKFDSAGTVAAKNIAKWDGSNWAAVGIGANDVIYSIATYQNEIYVGGIFDSIGGISANHIAKWNGSNWQSLGSGIQGSNIIDLYVFQDELYVLGEFSSAGNVPSDDIARWNGTTWSNVAGGVENGNSAMIEWNGNLLVGSEIHLIANQPYLVTKQWDGSNWTVFTQQQMFQTRAFTIFENELYCSGGGGAAAGPGVSLVARWDSTSWTTVGTGVNYYIQGLCAYNGELYCGGYFNTSQGGFHNYIARLSNSTGIPDVESETLFSVYPNPFQTELNLSISARSNTGIVTFAIYDLTGKLLYSKRLLNELTTIADFNHKGLFIWKLYKNGSLTKAGKLIAE
jgi:trimeric autotransporter adhesin